MSLESMIASLSPSEKLRAMELLWRELSVNLDSPLWHGEVLEARLSQPSTKPRLPLDEAMEEVRSRLNERRTGMRRRN